jgi:sterol desaturase/sphingolipid hydroxylase (fatty acid hydroxylase superfamily)
MNKKKFITYWYWLFTNKKDFQGYKKIFNKWLWLHFSIGVLLTMTVPLSLSQASNTVLLPLAGVFIGLSFAWAGNAQALLESKEIYEFSKNRKSGLLEYMYTFQTAILVIIVTLVLWGLAGLHLFDEKWLKINMPYLYYIIKTLLYFMSSLTLRECCHVVLGSQYLLQTKINNRAKN